MIQHIDFEPNARAPLDGIRVVDLSRLVAGNMLSLQLADQGAEVIKIEDPRIGDPLRAWRVKGLSLHWKVYARNKKSLALNLRPQAGRDALMDLLKGEKLEAFDRSVDVHISRIRAAIEDDAKKPKRILTVRGTGYVFARDQDR